MNDCREYLSFEASDAIESSHWFLNKDYPKFMGSTSQVTRMS